MFVGTAEPKESIGWLGKTWIVWLWFQKNFSNGFTQTQGQSLYVYIKIWLAMRKQK